MAYFISSRLWKLDLIAIIVSKVMRGIPELYSEEEQDGEIHFHHSRSTNSYYAGNIQEYKADTRVDSMDSKRFSYSRKARN
jgi:hypothetical protein